LVCGYSRLCLGEGFEDEDDDEDDRRQAA